MKYENITLLTYSPWVNDRLFNKTYESIKEFTLVDKYRCYELWQLVKQSSKLSEGSIIEIGTWRGGTGVLIAKQVEYCGIDENVYLCDTFKGTVKSGPKDSTYKDGKHADASKEIVSGLINQLNLNNTEILEGIFPEDTGNIVEKLKFRFCHIDVDTYQSAKDIIEWIWDKMVVGGIIVYDDYGSKYCDGITKYVNEQMDCKDRLIVYNLNGHAVVIKIPG